MIELPKELRVLPHVVPFSLHGFERQCADSFTFAPQEIDTNTWFEIFLQRVTVSLGATYLPICRISDGEFKFLLGEQPLTSLDSLGARLRWRLQMLTHTIFTDGHFSASTLPNVSSGSYSRNEVERMRGMYSDLVLEIAKLGILAVHLSYGPTPFQERFFPAFQRWLDKQNLVLTINNFVPFYFVYPLLTGTNRKQILGGQKLLCINCASGDKRKRIIDHLYAEGAKRVDWYSISEARSLFDPINVTALAEKPDLALIGAGVGKPNILIALRDLSIPAIDVGFLFDVWANCGLRVKRPLCAMDDEL